MPFDWKYTDLYDACKHSVPRFKKVSLVDKRAQLIINYITNIQKNVVAFQESHRLIAYFEKAYEYLEVLLNDDLNLPHVF